MTSHFPTAREIAAALESWADPRFAESYDNVGLHVGRADREVTSALVALDLTPAIINEADKLGADLIVTHHPLLFKAPRRVLDEDLQGHMILELARKDITLLSVHTNLDAVSGGVSFDLARRLGMHDITFLHLREDAQSGLGAVGRLPEPRSLEALLELIARKLKNPALRYAGDLQSPVQTVAVCGGSGSSLIGAALEAGADAYITADISYHYFFDVLTRSGQPGMALIDAGHYETERHTEELLCRWLQSRFEQVTFTRTSVCTNPIQTFLG